MDTLGGLPCDEPLANGKVGRRTNRSQENAPAATQWGDTRASSIGRMVGFHQEWNAPLRPAFSYFTACLAWGMHGFLATGRLGGILTIRPRHVKLEGLWGV